MNRHTYQVKMRENMGILFPMQCTTNSGSDPDGLSSNLLSVTRTATGKYTALLKPQYVCPQILWMDNPTLVGAAGIDAYLTSIDKDSSATSTITCDTKGNTTDDDYFTFHDGVQQWTVVLDKNGTGDSTGLGHIVSDISGATTAADISAILHTDISASAALVTSVDGTGTVALTSGSAGTKGNRGQQEVQSLSNSWAITDMTGGIDGVYGFKFETWQKTGSGGGAVGTVTFDTKVNTTDGDYFILNDGHRSYGFELQTASAVASHAIAATAATCQLAFDTKGNTTTGDWLILNDGHRRYGFELNKTAATALHHIVSTAATGTITCDTKTNTPDDDFFLLNDGQNIWAVVLDSSGNGSALSNGTDYFVDDGCELVINTSGTTSESDNATLLASSINGTSIQMTAVANGNDVDLTQDNPGAQSNTQQSGLGTLSNAWAVTDMTGGYDADVVADVWTVVNLTSGTNAVDVATLVHTAINGTDIQITSVDPTSGGVLNLTNDNVGRFGNAQQQFDETGATLFNVPDMTGALDADVQADVWNVCNLTSATSAAQVGTVVLGVINGTDIQITAADAGTPDGTLALVNDDYGEFGNTQSILSETGSTLLAITDMTTGSLGASLLDTNNYDVYFMMCLRNSKLSFR